LSSPQQIIYKTTDFLKIRPLEQQSLVPRSFSVNQLNTASGETAEFGQKQATSLIGSPIYRRGGQSNFELIPLQSDDLIATGSRLDIE